MRNIVRLMDQEKIRRRLQTERSGTASTLATITERLSIPQGESGGELSLMDQHPADAASETESRELDMTRQRMLEARVRRIDDALGRLDKGSYGRCVVCGQQIPEERLEALPDTPYCVRDAAVEERK